MYSKSSTKPLVDDAMKQGPRYILLIVLCLLLRPGVAEAVKVELDEGSSWSFASMSVNADGFVWDPFAGEVVHVLADSDSWSGSGTQYEGLLEANIEGYSVGYCEPSVVARVSVSSVSRSASPQPGEQSVEGQELYDIRFDVECTSWPCLPPPDSLFFSVPVGFNCELSAVGKIVWKLLPSTEDEEIGTPVIVSFRPDFSLGGRSGGTVYEFRIYKWKYGVIGKEMEGPYEISNYANPPDYGKTPVPDWEDLEIHASIGDTIKLSYKMEGYAYTQDILVPSNLNSDEEYPTMGLSLRVWAIPPGGGGGGGMPIQLDIKPNDCANRITIPIKAADKIRIPVAIIGSSAIDVSEVDRTSLLLEGVPSLTESVVDKCSGICDVPGPDGFYDLMLTFRAADVIEAIGGVNNGETVTLKLTGKLERDGEVYSFEIEDFATFVFKGPGIK